MTLDLVGQANDYVGKGLSGGKLFGSVLPMAMVVAAGWWRMRTAALPAVLLAVASPARLPSWKVRGTTAAVA